MRYLGSVDLLWETNISVYTNLYGDGTPFRTLVASEMFCHRLGISNEEWELSQPCCLQIHSVLLGMLALYLPQQQVYRDATVASIGVLSIDRERLSIVAEVDSERCIQ